MTYPFDRVIFSLENVIELNPSTHPTDAFAKALGVDGNGLQTGVSGF